MSTEMIRKKRKICVFSGKRGGLGAYSELINLISKDSSLELQLLLSDMHASFQFGSTASEARKLFPGARIEVMDIGTGRGDSAVVRAENLGLCLTKGVRILSRLRPDIILVHADRGEHLMMAFAALSLNIPIAHTQGGESSGNVDDIQRHAITKLAHLHFPETKRAANVIISLGEEKWRVHTAGSVYVDRIVKGRYPDPMATAQKYGLGGGYMLVIYHPETMKTSEENYRDADRVLRAVESWGIDVVVVYPCSDPGYDGVVKAIETRRKNPRFKIHKNIENLDFLALMARARVMVGNSSGAFVEAPYLKLPAVNVGYRQTDRSRSKNVVDAGHADRAIKQALEYVIEDKAFRKSLSKLKPHLGDGRASERIVAVLKSVKINRKLLEKKLGCKHY